MTAYILSGFTSKRLPHTIANESIIKVAYGDDSEKEL